MMNNALKTTLKMDNDTYLTLMNKRIGELPEDPEMLAAVATLTGKKETEIQSLFVRKVGLKILESLRQPDESKEDFAARMGLSKEAVAFALGVQKQGNMPLDAFKLILHSYGGDTEDPLRQLKAAVLFAVEQKSLKQEEGKKTPEKEPLKPTAQKGVNYVDKFFPAKDKDEQDKKIARKLGLFDGDDTPMVSTRLGAKEKVPYREKAVEEYKTFLNADTDISKQYRKALERQRAQQESANRRGG